MELNTWRKSTRSNPSGNCVEVFWKKSSYSNGNGGNNCVEVKSADNGGVLVRDTKLGDASPVLAFSSRDWLRFLEEIRDDFANPMGGEVGTYPEGAGRVMLNLSDTKVQLAFTADEWTAFIGGVLDGEFDLVSA